MINVDQITSRLAKLPDAALQQYAALHKNDPYIMSLAVAESNRRKELRNAAQQPQGGEMPKVADQEIAAMAPPRPQAVIRAPASAAPALPEEQGIGRLPVGDMNFAGGGIVAFADGGDVERYQSAGLVSPMRPGESWMEYRQRTFQESLAAEQARRQQEYEASEASRRAALAERGVIIPPSPFGIARPALVPDGRTAAAQPSSTAGYVRTDPRAAQFNIPSIADQAAAMSAPTADDTEGSSASAPTGRGAAPAAGLPAAAGASSATPMDVAGIFAAAQKRALEAPNPFADRERELATEGEAFAKERAARIREDQEKFKDIFKGREERLTQRGEELAKAKDTNTGLAFLNAGLAIMSTPGALATAIGKGARVGTEQYAAGLDKLRSAKDRLDEARDKLDELKANRAEMDAKDIREAELDIKRTALQGKKDLLAASKSWYGTQATLQNEVAKTTVTSGDQALDRASRERVAGMQLQATLSSPERVQWAALLKKHRGDALAAGKELRELQGEKFNPYTAYQDYLKAHAGKEMLSPPMSFAEYVTQFSLPKTTTPPPGATVLGRPAK